MANIEVLEHQMNFISDTTHRFVGLVGGYRSGKTFSICLKALHLALTNTELPGIITEPTFGMINRVLIPTMSELLYKLKIKFNLNKSECSYEIYFGDQVRKIWMLSSENFQRAAGISASYFLMDEVDLMKKDIATDAFNMLTSRLTRGELIQGCCASTPEGYNFLYDFFEENPDETKILYRGSTYANPFVDKSYFENMAKTHTETQLRAYLEGYFVNLTTGNVYYTFKRELNNTQLNISDFHPSYPLKIGVDFNVGKMAGVVSIIDNAGVMHVLEELFGDFNTEALINTIKRRYPNRQIHVYPDATGGSGKTSASTSDLVQLRNAGFQVFAKKTNPFVKDRVAAVNAKMCNSTNLRGIFINIQNCPGLVKSLEQQGYDNGVPDKSNGLDHMVDAFGYCVYYNFPLVTKNANRILI